MYKETDDFRREDFPLKTFDEVAYSVEGLNAYPANDAMCHRSWHPCEEARIRAFISYVNKMA